MRERGEMVFLNTGRVFVSIKYARVMTGIGFSVDKDAWGNGKVKKAQYKNSKADAMKLIEDAWDRLKFRRFVRLKRITGYECAN